MTIEQVKQLGTGTTFKFSLPGSTPVELTVESNDGEILTGQIVGGPRDGNRMTWHLVGLSQIQELSQ
jgi:hypothetical protein